MTGVRGGAGESPAETAPIGVYIHFPFCASRCHYCAFYFVVGRADLRKAYVEAVETEIARRAHDFRFAGRRAHSLYFGGGTPSLLEPGDVERLIRAANAAFPLTVDAEVSLESNPDGLSRERLRDLRAAGVNRLTLGWQSLRDAHLKVLTRTHTSAENLSAFEAARAAGFENLAVDLIFGVPGQAAAGWREELGEAAAAAPDHVSCYELTYEEGTRLTRRRAAGRFIPPDDDIRADLFEATDEVLAGAGIRRYEISNFAREGFECRHNLASWRGGDTAGFGASAASHVRNVRWSNIADLDEYVRRLRAGEETGEAPEIVDEETWAAEDLYLGLRTVDGIDADARLALVSEGGRERLASALDRAETSGHLVREEGRVRFTRKGILLADSLFEELLTPGV